MDSSQKASQQKGAVEGLQNEAEKIGGKIGQKAAEVLKNTAEQLAEGKLAGERGKIDGANANGGFAEESYKSGVISGAKLGTEYDSTKIIAGDKSTDGVAKFKHGSERIQQTRKDAIDNTLQKAVEETGMTPEEADKAILAASLGLGGLGINHMLGNPAGKLVNKVRGRKSSSGNSEFVGDSKNKSNNKSSSHQNNESNYGVKDQHGNTSSSDIKDYTKEYGQSKEAFERESRNLENLQHQRDGLISKGKDTSVIDNKIEDASKKVDMHRENMNIADRNVKASKYLAGKTPVSTPESFTSKALKFGGKALVGADAVLSGYDAYNQFQAGNTTGGVFSSAQSATAAAFLAKPGPALGAGDMPSTSQLIVGGERMNVDTDLNGNTLVNRDSQENIKRGRDSNYGITGYAEHLMGKAGEAAMFGFAGVGLAEGLARKSGMKDGIVKPAFKKTANGLSGMFGADKPFPETPKESVDSTSQSNHSQSTNSSESKFDNKVHDNSFNKDNLSIAEKAKLGQAKNGTVMPASSIIGERKPNLGSPLSEPGTIKPSGTVLDNPGFFEKRVQAVESALKHSKGGFVKTLSMVAGAAVLGNASETFGNAMSAVDPTSYLAGSDAGSGAYGGDELKQIMKSPTYKSSSAPSYAKNAFSTPSGFNTMNAMSGGAYGNMMDAKNMGAALHKTDHAQATVDKLQDINIASDYQKEAVEEQAEVSREFMERISIQKELLRWLLWAVVQLRQRHFKH